MYIRKIISIMIMTTVVGIHADQPVYLNPEVVIESNKPPVSLNITYEFEGLTQINKTYQTALKLAKNKFINEKDNQDPAIKQVLFQTWADSKVDVNVRIAAWQSMHQVDHRNQERFESSTQEEYQKLLNENKGLAEYDIKLQLKPKQYTDQWGVPLKGIDISPLIHEKAKGIKIKNNLLNGVPIVHLLAIDGEQFPVISYVIYSKIDPKIDSTLESKPLNGYHLMSVKMDNDCLFFPFPEKINSGVFLLRIQNDFYQIYLSPQNESDKIVMLPTTNIPFLTAIKTKGVDFSNDIITTGKDKLEISEQIRIKNERKQHPERFEPTLFEALNQLPNSVGFIEYTFNKAGKILSVNFKNKTNDGPPEIQLISERNSIESCKKELMENSIVVGPFSDFENGVTFQKLSSPQELINDARALLQR